MKKLATAICICISASAGVSMQTIAQGFKNSFLNISLLTPVSIPL
jgi:hypothetical protein